MIFLLVLILFFNLMVAHSYFKSLIAPPMLVGIGMFGAACIASMYYSEWELDSLLIGTVLIIGGGTFLFTLFCMLIDYVFFPKSKLRPLNITCDFFKEKYMLIFYLFLNLATYISTLGKISYLRSVLGVGSVGELMVAKHLDSFSESDAVAQVPALIRMTSNFSQIICYITLWCLALMLLSKKKNWLLFFLMLVHALLVIYDMMLSGSKGTMMTMPVSFVVIYIFMIYVKRGKYELKKKVFLYAAIFFFGSIPLFKGVSLYMGRDVEERVGIDLFAEYWGAEIKNFDIYMHRHPKGEISKSFGAYTFRAWNEEIGTNKLVGASGEFQNVNGYYLGNVYTMYYPYHADFGPYGMTVMLVIVALLSMFVYSKCIQGNANRIKLDMYIILYSIISFTLFMSFFSSKITENLFRPGFLRTIIYIIVAVWIFNNFLFENKKKNKINEILHSTQSQV